MKGINTAELDLDYQVKKEELFKEKVFFNKYSNRETNMSEYNFSNYERGINNDSRDR